jgi:hypothetical protein
VEHQILTATLVTLVVFGVVVVAIVIRNATEHTPESPVRLWTTRVSVATIMLWFATGLLREIHLRHGVFDLVLSRSFGRGILAIVLVWLVFRDEF